ncbi:MAG: RIP metalloprotease RseP [bacterium]
MLPTLIFLAIAILFHELGHFLACKLLGIRVEVFSFGFPPKLIGKKWGETEYAISLIPLGGYVKIAGQDPTEEVSGAPDEFVSHPLWHRSLVVFAGPLFNIIVALLITYIVFVVGFHINIFPNTVGIVKPNSIAEQAGLQVGDKITEISGKKIKSWGELSNLYNAGTTEKNLTILRQGVTSQIILPTFDEKTAYGELENDYGIYPYVPNQYVEVGMVYPNTIAYRAGLRQEDKILAITNISGATTYWNIIHGIRSSGNKPITMQVQRGDKILTLSATPELISKDAKYATIGFVIKAPAKELIQFSPIESIKVTFLSFIQTVYVMGKGIGDVMIGKLPFSSAFGGLPSMAIFAQQAAKSGLADYFLLVAALSISLGVINLVPFPVLDGGHLLYFLLEKIRKKPLSIKTLEVLTKFGVAVLVSFMIYLIVNDFVSSGLITRFISWVQKGFA